MSTDLDKLVACPGFRWMPGMLCMPGGATHEGGRYLGDEHDGCGNVGYRDGTAAHKVNSWLPDRDDPATLGCMLALVREAYGDPHLHAEFDDGVWVIYGRNYEVLEVNGVHFIELDEFDALAAALIAAPVAS